MLLYSYIPVLWFIEYWAKVAQVEIWCLSLWTYGIFYHDMSSKKKCYHDMMFWICNLYTVDVCFALLLYSCLEWNVSWFFHMQYVLDVLIFCLWSYLSLVLYVFFLFFSFNWSWFTVRSLPWQGLKAATKKQKYDKICEKKLSTPIEVRFLTL